MPDHHRGYTGHHTVQLIHSGTEYFDTLLELIEQAKHTLHLQVYILDPDETGLVILHALKEAAMRGVTVWLVTDGFGSMRLGKKFKEEMARADIRFRYFSAWPFPGIFQAGRRLHHKVAVADGVTALVGGINISDKYRGTEDEAPWLDYALLANGPVVKQIEVICEKIYLKQYTGIQFRRDRKKSSDEPPLTPVMVRVSVNDWLRGRNEISAAYKHMLNGAHKEILIMASYFTPTRRLLKILLRAAKRGRSVHIVLGKNSDIPFMKPAMEYLYAKLLRAGIHIYEYKKAVLHAKVCVVDQRWVSIGSHNLNHLSELLSVEMNLEVSDPPFAKATVRDLKSVMAEDCTPIRPEEHLLKATVPRKILQWTSYKIISWSMRLLYVINKRR